MDRHKMVEINTDDLGRMKAAASGYHRAQEAIRILEADCKMLRAQLDAVTRERDEAREERVMWQGLYNKAADERGAALERERRLRDHIKDALDLLEIETPFGAAEVLREVLAQDEEGTGN